MRTNHQVRKSKTTRPQSCPSWIKMPRTSALSSSKPNSTFSGYGKPAMPINNGMHRRTAAMQAHHGCRWSTRAQPRACPSAGPRAPRQRRGRSHCWSGGACPATRRPAVVGRVAVQLGRGIAWCLDLVGWSCLYRRCGFGGGQVQPRRAGALELELPAAAAAAGVHRLAVAVWH